MPPIRNDKMENQFTIYKPNNNKLTIIIHFSSPSGKISSITLFKTSGKANSINATKIAHEKSSINNPL